LGVNLAGVEIILNLLDRIEHLQEQMENEIEKIRQEMEAEMKRKLGELKKPPYY